MSQVRCRQFLIAASGLLAAVLVALGAPVAAQAQGQAAPPRSTADILAILDEHKPDPRKINSLREIAARQAPVSQDAIDQRNFYLERGRAAGVLGMVARQIEDLRKAYALTPKGDSSRQIYGLEMRVAELQSGDYTAALKSFDESVGDATSDGALLSAWSAITSVRAQTGNLADAREALKKAESLLTSLRLSPAYGTWSSTWQALFVRARGQVKRYEGKYADAEIDTRTAIRLWENVIDNVQLQRQFVDVTVEQRVQSMLIWEVHHLIPLLLEQGKLAEAELVARGSLKRALTTFGRYAPDTGWVLARFASTLFEQGRFAEASALGTAAEDIFLKIGAAPYSSILAEARRWIGESFTEQGKYADALAIFAAMRDGLKQNPSGTEGLTLASPAWIYALVRAGRASEATVQARDYYADLSKRFGDQLYATPEARGFHALALAADGKSEEALREFRAAIPVLLAAASERTSEEGLGLARTRRLMRILEAYISLLGNIVSQGKAPDGIDPAAEAFLIADVARGSSVQRSLTAASARAAIHDPALARLAREEQDGSQRISALSGVLVSLLARPQDKRPEVVIENIRRDVDGLRKRRGELRLEIERSFPDYANLIDPKPVSLEAARKMLRTGETLIALYGTEDRTFVWAIPVQGAARFHSTALGRMERDQMVTTLRRALDVGDAPLERFPQFDLEASHKLYAALLEPLEDTWAQASSLLIVPHSSLGQLPFSALVTRPAPIAQGALPFEGYKSTAWLLRRAAITQLPSVNTLVSLRNVTRARAPSKPFIGFGDPVFGTQQVASASLGARSMRLRSAPFEDPGAARKAVSIRLAQLMPLPDTAEEVEAIAKTLGATTQDVFVGVRASEQNVMSAELSERRVIAFATHGLVPGDLDGLTQPALALSNPAVTGEKDSDGLLTMEEILGLKLNADWVVLSACNTAEAEGAGGEAVSGLGRAFFYSGARALLVSNWPVETVSAKLLTTDIFRRQAIDPKLARAEALRQAMLHLMENETARDREGKPLFSYAHPMFWAPFTLVGDGAN